MAPHASQSGSLIRHPVHRGGAGGGRGPGPTGGLHRWFDGGRMRPVAVLVALLAAGPAAHLNAAPQIGYAYPAGAQRGTTVAVEVGGQSLRDVDAVRVSGQGVRAEVITTIRALNNQELRDTERFLRDLVMRRWTVRAKAEAAKATDEPPLPDHPWLRDLDDLPPNDLNHLRARLFDPRIQPNAQIAEKVAIALTVDADAPLGERELRLLGPSGISNPVCFQVGALPEFEEREVAGGAAGAEIVPPAILNGQIMPGEVDRIRLRACQGQRLTIRVQARQLIPYLADAVPGWFQAAASLHGPDGREVAWCDDHRFDPDPLLLVEIPADGVYELRVWDAIYRGREDFIYRIAVGELPWVTHVFPLGGREGTPANAATHGWNLPVTSVALDTTAAGPPVRTVEIGAEAGLSNVVSYVVDAWPDVAETEPNDAAATAQGIPFPAAVNGRIERAGDVDTFRFLGRAGQEIVAEVWARRLGSPLDSVLRLLHADGEEIAGNDDWKDREIGLLTHHADSRLQAVLPRDGSYVIQVADIQRQGSDAHAYRLQVRPPQPDFALRLVPSALTVSGSRAGPFTVHAIRKDGFTGEVGVELMDAPPGFKLSAVRIPAGQDSASLHLTVPQGAAGQVLPIRLQGRSVVAGQDIVRPVVAAEDMMQAFLWRFLVPRQELLVALPRRRPIPAVWRPIIADAVLTTPAPVRIPLGGTAEVRFAARSAPASGNGTPLAEARFQMASQPRGVTLRGVAVEPGGVVLTLKADRNTALTGDAGNVVVEASAVPPGGGDAATATRRLSLGVLPAVPFEIVGE